MTKDEGQTTVKKYLSKINLVHHFFFLPDRCNIKDDIIAYQLGEKAISGGSLLCRLPFFLE